MEDQINSILNIDAIKQETDIVSELLDNLQTKVGTFNQMVKVSQLNAISSYLNGRRDSVGSNPLEDKEQEIGIRKKAFDIIQSF